MSQTIQRVPDVQKDVVGIRQSGEGIEPSDVLDLLMQLVDKSMVLVGAQASVSRYRLLLWVSGPHDRGAAAAWLFGAAEAQRKVLGIEPRQDDEADHAHFVAVTQQQVGEAYAAAWEVGQAAAVDEAVSRALGDTRCTPAPPLAATDCSSVAEQLRTGIASIAWFLP